MSRPAERTICIRRTRRYTAKELAEVLLKYPEDHVFVIGSSGGGGCEIYISRNHDNLTLVGSEPREMRDDCR